MRLIIKVSISTVTVQEMNYKQGKMKNRELNLRHSGGNGSLGDLLSVNSVPRIKPVPRICRAEHVKLVSVMHFIFNIDHCKIKITQEVTGTSPMIGLSA